MIQIKKTAVTALRDSLKFYKKDFLNLQTCNLVLDLLFKCTANSNIDVQIASLQTLIDLVRIHPQMLGILHMDKLVEVTIDLVKNQDD